MKSVNALGLCDGISTGYHALKKAKIKVNRYESVEIDKSARFVADWNSNGEIYRLFHCVYEYAEYLKQNPDRVGFFDVVFLGFTCSSFTVQGKREGLKGESKIIFPGIDIIKAVKKVNPNVKFLIENVASMTKAHRKNLDELIFKELGVKSEKISSALLSGQARDRLYWTNIEFSKMRDRKIMANSILDPDGVELKAWSKSSRYECLETGKIYSNPAPGRRRYYEERFRKDGKSNTLVTGWGCKGPSTENKVLLKNGEFRSLSINECIRLQTLPKNFNFSMVTQANAYKMIGLGWTLDVIAHILKGLK